MDGFRDGFSEELSAGGLHVKVKKCGGEGGSSEQGTSFMLSLNLVLC